MNLYRESTQLKDIIANQILTPFCSRVPFGDPIKLTEILYNRYTVEDFSFSDDYKYWIVRGYFLEKVVPHKIAVFEAGDELAQYPWFFDFIRESRELWYDNLLLHDLSKFSANESVGYAFHDFKSSEPDIAFERAWNHHKNHNEHHPEYWLHSGRDGICSPLDMPNIFIAEMVADWIGAGKTYGSTIEQWLPKNLHKFRFSEKTIESLKELLKRIGIETTVRYDTSLDGSGLNLLFTNY